MTAISDSVKAVLEDPYVWARQARQEGRKVVGITPMHFPEEVVHATGALPVVLQESHEPVTAGFAHLYPFYCGFTRSSIDMAVRDKLGFFDAVVVSDICLQMRWMGQIMMRRMPNTPFVYMQWPLEANTDRWLGTTVRRLQAVRERLDKILGTETSDTALAASIALYEERRTLLQRLYNLRRVKRSLLSAAEMMALFQAGMVMPVEEHIKAVKAAITAMEEQPAPKTAGARVFLSGHLCQAPRMDVLGLIESLGGVVVGDDIYAGFRYYATPTPENVGSPVEALARRYLRLSVPCPTRADFELDWGQFVANRCREDGAQGVVTMVVKYCEPHMIAYPHVKTVLDQLGVPHVLIETEHEVVSMEGIRTRLQAFIEMLNKG